MNTRDALHLGLAFGDLAAKSVVILLAAWLTTMAMKRGSAASRNLVWLAAFSLLLLLPVSMLIVPPHQIAVVREAALPASVAVEPTSPPQLPLDDFRPNWPTLPSGEKGIDVPVFSGVPEAAERSTSTQPTSSKTFDWVAISAGLVGLWLFGCLCVIGRGLAGLWALRTLKNNAAEVGEIDRMALARQVGLRSNWTLCVSKSAEPPAAMTWGLIRPVVLIPKNSVSWTQERLEAVLLHELAHVRRRDSMSQLIAVAASALYWFNPAVWLCARAMRAEAERAADDTVIRLGVKPSDYARELTRIAAELGTRRQPFTSIGVPVMKQSKIESRVRAILDPAARRRRGVTLIEAMATSCVALVVMLPLGAFRAAIVRDPAPKASVPVSPDLNLAKQRIPGFVVPAVSVSVKRVLKKPSRQEAMAKTASTARAAVAVRTEDSPPSDGSVEAQNSVSTAAPSDADPQAQGTSGSSSSTTGTSSQSGAKGTSTTSTGAATGSSSAQSFSVDPVTKRWPDGQVQQTYGTGEHKTTITWSPLRPMTDKQRSELLLKQTQAEMESARKQLAIATKSLDEQRRAFEALEKQQKALLAKAKAGKDAKGDLVRLIKAEEQLIQAQQQSASRRQVAASMQSNAAYLHMELLRQKMQGAYMQKAIAAQQAAAAKQAAKAAEEMERVRRIMESADHQRSAALNQENALRRLQSMKFVETAQVKLKAAKEKLERLTRLYQVGTVSKEDLDEARSDVDIKKAEVEQWKANLGQLNGDGSIKPKSVPLSPKGSSGQSGATASGG